MVRKILSDLISGVRGCIAWGLEVSPPSRLTLSLLKPRAAQPAPRPSSSLPPCSEVVARRTRVDAIRDLVASLLFLLWRCDMRLRTEVYEWKRELRKGYAWGQIYTGFGL